MRMFSWLQSLKRSLKRASARRTRRAMAQLERLEDRTVPVVITCAGVGLLSVTLDGADMELSIHAASPDFPVVVTVDGVDHVPVLGGEKQAVEVCGRGHRLPEDFVQLCGHLVGDDTGQSRLASAGRPDQQG